MGIANGHKMLKSNSLPILDNDGRLVAVVLFQYQVLVLPSVLVYSRYLFKCMTVYNLDILYCASLLHNTNVLTQQANSNVKTLGENNQ